MDTQTDSYYQRMKDNRSDDGNPENDERMHERRRKTLTTKQVQRMGQLLSDHGKLTQHVTYVSTAANSVNYLVLAGVDEGIKCFGADFEEFLTLWQRRIEAELKELGVVLPTTSMTNGVGGEIMRD